MEYLYILVSATEPCFKVGITSNIESRLNSIEASFGKINKLESEVYQHPQRRIVEKIESGVHGYLDKYSFHTSKLGNGSTEWFHISALEKCKMLIEIFQGEINDLEFVSHLDKFMMPVDYSSKISSINKAKEFHDFHTKIIHDLDDLIYNNKNAAKFFVSEGTYIIEIPEKPAIEIRKLPRFEWVRVRDNQIILDIRELNKWKRERIHNELRKLVEIKFFNKIFLKDLSSWMKLKEMNNDYLS